MGFCGGSDGEESACNAGIDPWVRKIPWRRKWPPTPVFLPGEFHGVAKSQTWLSTHVCMYYPKIVVFVLTGLLTQS